MGVPEAPRRNWDTLRVVPCDGGAVRVECDGETLTADEIKTWLLGGMGQILGGGSIERMLTTATGRPRAERRKMARRRALTVAILRDQAIRHLHVKRGLGIRAVAKDLGVGRATVARALMAAGRDRTRRDKARLAYEGYEVKPTPLESIRLMIQEGKNDGRHND